MYRVWGLAGSGFLVEVFQELRDLGLLVYKPQALSPKLTLNPKPSWDPSYGPPGHKYPMVLGT